jgi:hypothetical protein
MKLFIAGLLLGLALYFAYDHFIDKKLGPFKLEKGQMDGKAYTSAEVDYATLNQYVKNYRDYYPDFTFAFNVDTSDIEELRRQTGCKGLRVYFGLKTASENATGTAILVGVNGDNSDAYIQRTVQGRQVYRGVDECSPCPSDCPDDGSPLARLGKLP